MHSTTYRLCFVFNRTESLMVHYCFVTALRTLIFSILVGKYCFKNMKLLTVVCLSWHIMEIGWISTKYSLVYHCCFVFKDCTCVVETGLGSVLAQHLPLPSCSRVLCLLLRRDQAAICRTGQRNCLRESSCIMTKLDITFYKSHKRTNSLASKD